MIASGSPRGTSCFSPSRAQARERLIPTAAATTATGDPCARSVRTLSLVLTCGASAAPFSGPRSRPSVSRSTRAAAGTLLPGPGLGRKHPYWRAPPWRPPGALRARHAPARRTPGAVGTTRRCSPRAPGLPGRFQPSGLRSIGVQDSARRPRLQQRGTPSLATSQEDPWSGLWLGFTTLAVCASAGSVAAISTRPSSPSVAFSSHGISYGGLVRDS